jgi:hypothetical protein
MRAMQPSERNRLVIPGQEKNAATQVEGPSWLTQEMWDGLSNKKIAIDTLKPEQQTEFSEFLGKLANGEVKAPEAPAAPAAPAPEATPVATPPATPAPTSGASEPKSPADIPLADPAKREEFFRKYQEKSVEANKVNQLQASMRTMKEDFARQFAELKARPITTPNAEDPLAAESVKSQAEMLRLLQDQLALVTDHMAKQNKALEDFHTYGASQVNEQVSLLGLERFQYETQASDLVPPELGLNTTIPLPLLNAELATFSQKVGGMDNVNKYLKDPAFKAAAEAQGLKLSEGFVKNLDKFNLIYDLNEEVKAGKFPDHMAAYSHHLITSGKLAEALRNAKLAGASAVANGVASNHQATPMLAPGADGTQKVPAWTKRSAMDWLAANRDKDIRPGSAEGKTLDEITQLMTSGQLR